MKYLFEKKKLKGSSIKLDWTEMLEPPQKNESGRNETGSETTFDLERTCVQ
jgi:hypothetical protein